MGKKLEAIGRLYVMTETQKGVIENQVGQIAAQLELLQNLYSEQCESKFETDRLEGEIRQLKETLETMSADYNQPRKAVKNFGEGSNGP